MGQGSGAGAEIAKRLEAVGRQGGRAGKFYILPLQARRSQNRLLHFLREGGAHFGHPYHNKEGRCIRCRHPVVFKALGRAGYFQTDKYYAYLVQRCRDGFVVREFRADRTYRKDTLPHSEPYWHEFRRSIYDRTGEIRSYYWGCTASGKHAGSREAPAIMLIMVINPAGYMERLCPAWRKKNFVKPACRVDTKPSDH